MKFHFASFLIAIPTGVQAASIRGSSQSNQEATTSNNKRNLSSPEILDLEEFIRNRASGVIGNRLLPSLSTFESLDTGSFYVNLRDDTMVLGPLNFQEQDPESIDRVTYNNDNPSAQVYDLTLSGKTSREFSASVTSGFKFQQEIKAKVGFKGIADVTSTSKFEFSLSSTTKTTDTVEEEFTRTLSLSVPKYTRIQATQLVSTVVSDPSFTIDFEIIGTTTRRNCNPGVFQNERWACEANPWIATGNSCSSGWELCDNIQGHCNPGLFDDGQRYHCRLDQDMFVGNACSSGWSQCHDNSNYDPALCYYFRDSQGRRNYMCSSVSEIFLQGQLDHSFEFRQTGDTIRYQSQGQFTGVGGRDIMVDVVSECLSPFVSNSDGLCVPASEVDDTVGSLIFPEPYRKERYVLDEDGNVAKIYDMMN